MNHALNPILKHIPNALTIMRLLSIVPILYLLYLKNYEAAFIIFFIAGLTDGLDGWLARHFHWKSDFGSMLDPLTDKLFIVCAFIALALIGTLPWWFVFLVLARDLTISIGIMFWYILVQQRLDFNPSVISKINTGLQILLITLCLFELAFFVLPNSLIYGLILITSLTTSISYIDYVWTWGIKAHRAIVIQRHE